MRLQQVSRIVIKRGESELVNKEMRGGTAGGRSVGLEDGELLRVPQSLLQSLPVLEVDGVVLHPGVEGPLQAVLAQVLAGEDAEGAVEGTARLHPQRPQLRDRVHVTPVLLEHPHELFFRQSQMLQHAEPAVPVLPDEPKDSLGEVLDHILGLGLLLTVGSPVGTHLLGFLRRTLDFAVEARLPGRLLVGEGVIAALDDLDVVLAGGGFVVGVGAGAELFQIVQFAVGGGLALRVGLVGGGAAVGAGEFAVELLVELVLLLQQLHDQYVLGVDHLHHLVRDAQISRLVRLKLRLRRLQLPKS